MKKKEQTTPIDPLVPPPSKKSALLPLVGLLFACALIVLAIFLCRYGVRHLYRENPAFLLSRIEVLTSNEQMRVKTEECLHKLQIQEGLTNLTGIDLRAVRNELCKNPRVANIELQRIFPGTLRVTVKPRVPVAILRFPPESGRGELKVDQEGYVLPQDLPGVTAVLPRITGLTKPENFVEGQKTEDVGVLAFLEFLKKSALRPDGAVYEVFIARLDTENEKMTLYLEANGPFKQSARIVMPTSDISTHLDRIGVIVELKRNRNQTISYVNATYNNIPVRP